MPTKKSAKQKAKPRRPNVKTSVAEKPQTIAGLRQQLAEALQREDATSDVLRLIASSAKNLEQVLSAVAENAAAMFERILQNAVDIKSENDLMKKQSRSS